MCALQFNRHILLLARAEPCLWWASSEDCGWIGGVDLNQGAQDTDGATILLSLSRKIQVVRIGEDARLIKKIDFAASKLSVRRDTIVCVADSRSYALLEIDRQLKIPLMSISSLDEIQSGTIVGQAQDISGSAGGGLLRSNSSTQARAQTESPDPQTHRRGTSLGNLISGVNRRQEQHAVGAEEPGSRSVTPPESVASPGPPEAVFPAQSTAPDEAIEGRPLGSMRPGLLFSNLTLSRQLQKNSSWLRALVRWSPGSGCS